MRPIIQSIKERASALPHVGRSRGKWGGFAFWSLMTTIVLFLLKLMPGVGRHIGISPWVALVVWIFASLPALFRWMRWRLLWRLRNRLFVTYLLIGVTPIVLFCVLGSIAAYVLFGQFANFAATSEIQTELVALAANTEALALHFQHELATQNGAHTGSQIAGLPAVVPPEAEAIMNMPELEVGVYVDGKLQHLDLPPGHALKIALAPAPWVNGSFQGLILSKGRVYFSAITREPVGAQNVSVVTGLPIDSRFLGRIVNGLGRMTLWPGVPLHSNLSFAPDNMKIHPGASPSPAVKATTSTDNVVVVGPGIEKGVQNAGAISGGVLPKSSNTFDIPISFPTTLDVTDGSTGKQTTVTAIVTSRPSLLYQRLFRESLLIGGSVRVALITVGVLFGCLEIFAIFLASRLSRTITRSVADLYHATREVDQGRLNYRIPVKRQDQLAALSRSFNTMSASLVRLLDEQKEKERLQSELAIAQEVQANLFPLGDVRVGELDLHGFCRPARTVSGDYYDFLVLGDCALSLAVGDISGKGISAALLMAGLHSAVRAYSFAGEEMFVAQPLGSACSGQMEDASAEVFQSPGNLMRLLNLHLFRSTQQEKYATLFLAHYDAATRMLRYSNGGQLPPLVLRSDGSVVRLDRGGTVVGLLDNMEYEEGAVALEPGDLLIAYSDGVTEPENEFGDFGEERMVELVHSNRHLPLDEISSCVLKALDDWIGAEEQPDDITFVLARQN